MEIANARSTVIALTTEAEMLYGEVSAEICCCECLAGILNNSGLASAFAQELLGVQPTTSATAIAIVQYAKGDQHPKLVISTKIGDMPDEVKTETISWQKVLSFLALHHYAKPDYLQYFSSMDCISAANSAAFLPASTAKSSPDEA